MYHVMVIRSWKSNIYVMILLFPVCYSVNIEERVLRYKIVNLVIAAILKILLIKWTVSNEKNKISKKWDNNCNFIWHKTKRKIAKTKESLQILFNICCRIFQFRPAKRRSQSVSYCAKQSTVMIFSFLKFNGTIKTD